jgi:hypothetical protein
MLRGCLSGSFECALPTQPLRDRNTCSYSCYMPLTWSFNKHWDVLKIVVKIPSIKFHGIPFSSTVRKLMHATERHGEANRGMFQTSRCKGA